MCDRTITKYILINNITGMNHLKVDVMNEWTQISVLPSVFVALSVYDVQSTVTLKLPTHITGMKWHCDGISAIWSSIWTHSD